MLIRPLTVLALASSAAATLFDTNPHAPRGLAQRHRTHRAAVTPHIVVPRAGAAYNETDHDSTASIEIGGAQRQTSSSASAAAATTTSSAVMTRSTADVSSVATSVDSVTQVVTSVTSTSSPGSSTVVSSSASSSIVSSPATASSSTASSTTDSPSTVDSSSTSSTVTSTTAASTASQIISTVRSTVTDPAASVLPTPSSSTRGARTGSVSIKTASVSATASAAALAAGGTTGMSSGTKTAIIVVCVVGGVALGAFALWTIIRRWKLRPSRRFDGRMKPLDFSPTSPSAFYEKPYHRRAGSTSSADRQRRAFVDELDHDDDAHEVYDHHVHAQQYDLTGMEGGAALAGGGGVASSYPHAYDSEEDDGYTTLHRGPSPLAGPTTFAGIGAGGAGIPGAAAAAAAANATSYQPQMGAASPSSYRDDGSDGYHPSHGLAREPSLGRPTRGEGPYAAATHFAGSGPRY